MRREATKRGRPEGSASRSIPSSQGEVGAGEGRQDLGHRVMAERRFAWIGGVEEGVALVEAPTGFDADRLDPWRSPRPARALRAISKPAADDRRVGGRVVQNTARSRLPGKRIARRRSSAFQVAGRARGAAPHEHRGRQPGRAPAGPQQVEGVARDHERTWAFRTLKSACASITEAAAEASVRFARRGTGRSP